MGGAPQTSVSQNPDRALPGGLADITVPKSSISGPAGEVIPYGALAIKETDGKIMLPDAAADITNVAVQKGIAVRRHHFETKSGSVDQYDINESVELLVVGSIWAKLKADMALENPVEVRFQNGDEGDFTGTSTGDTATLAGAIVREAGTAAGDAIAKLDIKLP